HTFSEPSSDVETIIVPSGLMAHPVTSARCPTSFRDVPTRVNRAADPFAASPQLTPKILSVRSDEAETMNELSGATAQSLTIRAWALKTSGFRMSSQSCSVNFCSATSGDSHTSRAASTVHAFRPVSLDADTKNRPHGLNAQALIESLCAMILRR